MSATAQRAHLREAGVHAAAAVGERSAFVKRLAAAFEDADVRYVLLHGYGDGHYLDSDVDVAVGRADAGLVDLVIRSGRLGPLLQRIHHDVPWCRYYVVGTGNDDRRYRQIDVACDPWGLSELGPAIARAVRARRGRPATPGPAQETLYLLAKRALKGIRTQADLDAIVLSYRRDRGSAKELISDELGAAGKTVVDDLDAGTLGAAALEEVRTAVARRRRRPGTLALRALFSVRRALGRLGRPTGLSIALAGPDGVGKSTLAAELRTACAGAFWQATRLHGGPTVLPRRRSEPGRTPPATRPHAEVPSSAVPSVARVLYHWTDTLLAWAPQVALPRRRSALVIIERGWRDLEVDPTRYRLGAAPAFVRLLGSLLPRPDLVLVLTAPPSVVAERKSELPRLEIERQVCEWRQIAAGDPNRYVEIDASRPPSEVRDAALRAIEAELMARQPDLVRASLALRALGGLRRGGRPHSLATINGEARWLLPACIGARGPLGTGLYRPYRARQAIGAAALEYLHRSGASCLRRTVPLATHRGVGAAIAARLGQQHVTLAASTSGDRARGQRAVLSVGSGDRVLAFAKLADEEGERLRHEARVLRQLASLRLDVVVVPRVLDCFDWDGIAVLLLEPLPISPPADRPFGAVELDALVELRKAGGSLRVLLGGEGGAVHGDFAPWNTSVVGDGRLAVWDWEETRAGSPIEDFFHWQVHRYLRGADCSLEDIVDDALGPGERTAAVARRLGIDPLSAGRVFRSYLDRTLGDARYLNGRGVPAVREAELARVRAERW